MLLLSGMIDQKTGVPPLSNHAGFTCNNRRALSSAELSPKSSILEAICFAIVVLPHPSQRLFLSWFIVSDLQPGTYYYQNLESVLLSKHYFQILSSSGIILPDGIGRPRRETEEGLKSHHALFRWIILFFCVASLSGRRSIGCLVTALRGLRPLVPCYARSRPYRDGT